MARAKKAAARPAWEPLVGEDKIVATEAAMLANGWAHVGTYRLMAFGGSRGVELHAVAHHKGDGAGKKDVRHSVKIALDDRGIAMGREIWIYGDGVSDGVAGHSVDTLDEALAMAMAAKPDGLP